ncbi:hypothetical protein [Dysgonomonas sp. HGC4]|uniref:hypothetical protein n=1 Tax=Dysgonomonas sp. HGC4 TaxID=1658009 RepID=UPI00067FE2DB|nr:hypothetical protein [Dysgonomonas sp. HGC4]MBD8347735.1 hypothetical protein [Dysgonomonas sp. HGC4]
MASTAEILAKGALLEPWIFLYREGIFWKAYQQSAYRVLQRKPGFRLKKKFVKAVSCEVVSLGFPDETLERIFNTEEIENAGEKMICIQDNDIDMQAYREWFDAVPLSEQKENVAPPQPELIYINTQDTVLKKIREFPIEQSTPIDCMIFLVSVRKELKEKLF